MSTTIDVPSAGDLTLLENPVRKRDYLVEIEALEFTSVCPMTGQPDYAIITISYIPDKIIFELKSLKLYLQTFRNKPLTHEEAVNEIYDKIEDSVKPKNISVKGQFSVRGGIKTTVIAESPNSRRDK